MARDNNTDRLYNRLLTESGSFRFDESVAKVFPDMINRSVPGYGTVVSLTGVIASYFAMDNTSIYDLGCSLGASTLSMRHQVTASNCSIIAIDNSEAMIDRCRQNLQSDSSLLPVELIHDNIENTSIRNASVVVLNFTLQFIPPERRSELLRKIMLGINPGGALILSEKICFPGDDDNELYSELHYAFKKANGYSSLEISQKRSALENVLFPETSDQHRQRLLECGFTRVSQWFQCLNFASFLGVK